MDWYGKVRRGVLTLPYRSNQNLHHTLLLGSMLETSRSNRQRNFSAPVAQRGRVGASPKGSSPPPLPRIRVGASPQGARRLPRCWNRHGDCVSRVPPSPISSLLALPPVGSSLQGSVLPVYRQAGTPNHRPVARLRTWGPQRGAAPCQRKGPPIGGPQV